MCERCADSSRWSSCLLQLFRLSVLFFLVHVFSHPLTCIENGFSTFPRFVRITLTSLVPNSLENWKSGEDLKWGCLQETTLHCTGESRPGEDQGKAHRASRYICIVQEIIMKKDWEANVRWAAFLGVPCTRLRPCIHYQAPLQSSSQNDSWKQLLSAGYYRLSAYTAPTHKVWRGKRERIQMITDRSSAHK